MTGQRLTHGIVCLLSFREVLVLFIRYRRPWTRSGHKLLAIKPFGVCHGVPNCSLRDPSRVSPHREIFLREHYDEFAVMLREGVEEGAPRRGAGSGCARTT
jgi:hypothetical protein